jgi:hypothetical protein
MWTAPRRYGSTFCRPEVSRRYLLAPKHIDEAVTFDDGWD